MRVFTGVFIFATLLAACTPRGQAVIVPQAAEVGSVQTIFIGTTRGKSDSGVFDGSRSEMLSFGRYDVSVPPNREGGNITWPKRRGVPDPTTQFLTTKAGRYSGAADFRTALRQDLRRKGSKEAVIFIHGFNNTYSEGIYRIAQMAKDLDLPGSIVHYSWPSAAQPLGYVYDRDSALYARDGLETLLSEVEAAGAERVVLVAHSMGSAVTMETLRQIAIRGDQRLMNRVDGVILISPDLDVDLFRAQALSIPELPQPFLIFASERDLALRVSARLTGQSDRLGTLTNLDKVKDLPITILDTAAFSKGAGHFNLGDSPSLLRLFDGITSIDASLSAERAARVGLLPGAVMTVQNATQIILSPVVAVSNELQR